MQDVRLQFANQAGKALPDQKIGRVGFAADRDAMHAEGEARRDFGQRRIGTFAASEAVGEDADMGAAIGRAVGKIDDVTKYSTHWGANRVEDAKRLIGWRCHDQNQRSPTSTVSPGLSGVPSGTMARSEPDGSVWVRVTASRLARGEKPPAIATALSTLMLGT